MKYKMFVADYDGTLGHAPNVIQPETLQTVKEYISKGGRFLVCSGREQKSISDILKNYGIEGDVICCQGAVLSDIKTGEKKISGGVETNFALELIDELDRVGGGEAVMIVYETGLIINRLTEGAKLYIKHTSNATVVKENLQEFVKKDGGVIHKILLKTDLENCDRIIKHFQSLYPEDKLCANSGAPGLVELNNPEYIKGKTLLKYVTSLGIHPEEVLTVGDSTNDLSLMDFGFYGVAVGDGSEELKKKAKEVTVPYSQNPVAHLLKKYFL